MKKSGFLFRICLLALCLLFLAGCGSGADGASHEAQKSEGAAGLSGLFDGKEEPSSILSGVGFARYLSMEEMLSEVGDKTYFEAYVPEGGSIALVLDKSRLDDGCFNEALYRGVQQYAYSAGETYSVYMAEGEREEDNVAALRRALSVRNCRLVVTAGTFFEEAVGEVMEKYPSVSFLMVDGVPRDAEGEELPICENVHSILFEEQEAGYLAGFMSVLEGYRHFGFIGGWSVDPVIRYGSGFLQGIDDAVGDFGIEEEVSVKYWYSESFEPTDSIYEVAVDWYEAGTEIIFACGGSLYESVLAAAEETDGVLIGVDVNQNEISERFLTSAVKGVDRAAVIALDNYFANGGFPEEMAGHSMTYGVTQFCAGLPLDPWRFENAPEEAYEALCLEIRQGKIGISNDTQQMPSLSFDVDFFKYEGEDASEASVSWSHQQAADDAKLAAEAAEAEQEESDEGEAVQTDSYFAQYEKRMGEYDLSPGSLYEIPREHLNRRKRTEGEIPFAAEEALRLGRDAHCLLSETGEELVYQCRFEEIPASDNDEIYLFALDLWESDAELSGEPCAVSEKAHAMEFRLPFEKTDLFARFVPALLVDGAYVPVAEAKYPANPEVLAENKTPYPEVASIKGILLDPNCLGTEKLTKLNVKRGVYNIPLSSMVGESTNPDLPSTEYEYNGRTYLFNTATVAAYDNLFKYLQDAGIHATAIVLNDWNDAAPELIHPLSRQRTGSSLYYAFNTEEEEGVRLMEACALFLAERYAGGEHGRVYDWVIANEIDQHTSWNYMNTTDPAFYMDSFERSFHVFYSAVRSVCPEALVYYSLDHDWNNNLGYNSRWFNGRELLYLFNEYALRRGNYDWGIAIHPYPDPLTKVNYWSKSYDHTEEAPILTIMNLSALTNVLEKEVFRTADGSVRSAAVTELGFSSYSGEKLQAAAFAYCYYILESNPYIDSFLMNRQTDALEEIRAGLALGVYNTDLSEKYIAEVFAEIDEDPEGKWKDFTVQVLGAESFEAALSWANP